MQLINGDKLNAHQREQVLSAFVHRWTTGNQWRTTVYKCDKCDIRHPYENSESANGHHHPTIPLISDEQWLKEHAFWITRNGELSQKHNRAEYAK